MVRSICIAVGLFGLVLLAGCSTYVDDFHYAPRPALAEVRPAPPEGVAPVSAMASIIGVRRADQKDELPACVEVRLRLENGEKNTLRFNPASLNLINGVLWQFPAAIVRPPEGILLQPGEAAIVTAYFPFPAGRDWDDIDMESLQLRWTVQIDGRAVGQAAYFHRIRGYYYYDPYWGYPGYGWVGGVVIIHRHR